ncbi:MAG TPA: AI-2E family transporter [Anaerolineales bacterium]|nr:AI-2E family transporter [Anaerolineales bacterium]
MEDKFLISPRWSSTTKLLVGLVAIGIFAFLLARFQSLIPPLLIIIIISYLFHPLAALIANGLGVSWKAAVGILYLSIFISIIGLLTVGGIGLVGQVQSLIDQVQSIIADIPALIEEISGQVYKIGPFTVDMPTIAQSAIVRQVLSFVQPLLGRTGNLVAAVASGAAQIVGWTFFILIVSYFIVNESNGISGNLIRIDLPGHSEDLRKLSSQMGRIWNGFLRGQIIIFFLAFVIYAILLNLLGVRFALGLALMAGLARFLPYIGPAITWITMALVTFFQASKPFGLEENPLVYVAIVVGLSLFIDQVLDNYVSPRIMAQTLRVHPAAVLVAALIMANLLGVLGVVIAAPLLASLTLLSRYTMRKMFDQDPFPPGDAIPPTRPVSREWRTRLSLLRRSLSRSPEKNVISDKEKQNEQ